MQTDNEVLLCSLDIELEAPNKWPIYACCEGSKLVNVTIDSIVLFYALYETRSISELYSNEELDEMEEILRAASKLVNSVGEFRCYLFVVFVICLSIRLDSVIIFV
ncbi:unnamed protein product [Anisakis simplex]|uniref:KIND domain-containing protein n=1 Tax=Anisakis simplex TaxID=6269 RepID=A0A0M3KJN5_ANISI|nr:unnamed protein product [Anisakis simplex]